MHTDHFTCVVDGNVQSGGSMTIQFLSETAFVSDQNNRDAELTGSIYRPLDLYGRSIIASHGINCNSHSL